ncbi:MAG: M28 family peptidase [Saprospiraceae bacterium]|nr:M28 family peptidase [Saprospiraceae bacterium]
MKQLILENKTMIYMKNPFANIKIISRICGFVLIMMLSLAVTSQSDYELLRDAMLGETPIADDLKELCEDIGGRITGSKANKASVNWAFSKLNATGLKTWKDGFEMPVLWLPQTTKSRLFGPGAKTPILVSKYGTERGIYSSKIVGVGTGTEEEFESKSEVIKDRFVIVETELCLDINGLFAEYAHAAKVEELAYKHGAKGIIFMSSRPKGLLYRFITSRGTSAIIPQFIMAREDARFIMDEIARGQHMEITITVNSQKGGSFQSQNVIAEIPGTKYPDEVIVIGAHLDSWAMGQGANDNGCNVSMMIDIARQIKALNIQPDRTIRFALWNGEEQGYFGSWDYTKENLETLDNHIMALSVDIGSGGITGFFTNGRQELMGIVDKVLEPVSEYGPFTQLNIPIVGTDNFDFMLQGVPNLVANHKPFNYGLNYHASTDTYDKVDIESLKQNAAIVAVLTLGFANLDPEEAAVLKRQTREEVQDVFDKSNLEFTMRMFNVWEPWINGERGIK